jgi:phosphate transport system substrate-binding protein
MMLYDAQEGTIRTPSRSTLIAAFHCSLWVGISGLLLALTLALTAIAQTGLTGRIIIAGHGPEFTVLQDLARAFEKRAPGTAIDFNWDKTVRSVELVKRGEAQIAVTDQPDKALSQTQIAWDGIALIVNFANPIKELTTSQVRALLTGQIARWSDLDGADVPVELIPRSPQANLSTGLESALGVPGKLAGKGRPIINDQQALSAVSGHDAAVTYLSLNAALRAQEDGIPIRILTIDQVEAGEPTVRDGRYKLRRPVLLLTTPSPDPVTTAFVAFALSPEGQQLVRPMFASVDSAVPPAKVQGTGPPHPMVLRSP